MKRLKPVIIFLIAAMLISLAGGWISYISYGSVFIKEFISIFIFTLKLSAFLFLIYYPVLWFIKNRWEKRRASKRFSNSQTENVISKFLNNTTALLGIITIFYAMLLAVFGHFIAPDTTPYANYQMNEIAYKDPGFCTKVLSTPATISNNKTTVLKWLLYGKQSNTREIPINRYWFQGDSVYAERYFDENIPGQIIGYKLNEITNQDISRAENRTFIENEHIHTRNFVFGTDDLGRDYLSRIIIGVRVSLSVGFAAVFIALLIGIPLGAFAGFHNKHPLKIKFKKTFLAIPLDDILMWFINVIWAIPTLLLVFPIIFAFGQNFYTIFIAVGLTMWVDIARIVRGQVMSIRNLEYIQATKTFAFSNMRVIFKHILPNISGPVIVITAANFAYAILTEAGLSFLGIGVQPPAPSWGLMISKYKDNLITNAYLGLLPGFAITLLVLAFFMVGNGIRDALDVKTKIQY